MTNVILQTFEGRRPEDLGEINSAQVWTNYIDRKFDNEKYKCDQAGIQPHYSRKQMHPWLKWLSQQLENHTQDQHRFFIEEIQPDWLPRKNRPWFYFISILPLLLATSLVSLLAFRAGVPVFYGTQMAENFMGDFLKVAAPLGGLWIATLIWILSRRSAGYQGLILLGLLSGLTFGIMIWIPYRNMPALALAGGSLAVVIVIFLARFVIRILGESNQDIVCVKSRRWDWIKALSGMLIGLVFITMIGVISDVSRSMFMDGLGFWNAAGKAASFNTIVWWNWGLPGLLSMGLFLFFVLGRGWGALVLREEVDKPNQGIIDSGRTGLFIGSIGILAGLIFSLAIGIPCFFGIGWKVSSGTCVAGDPLSIFSGFGFGIAYGLILGLIFGLIFGGYAWIKHHLVRWLLHIDAPQLPTDIKDFLQFACKLNLLRRVGGGYEFIDQDLQSYFLVTEF